MVQSRVFWVLLWVLLFFIVADIPSSLCESGAGVRTCGAALSCWFWWKPGGGIVLAGVGQHGAALSGAEGGTYGRLGSSVRWWSDAIQCGSSKSEKQQYTVRWWSDAIQCGSSKSEKQQDTLKITIQVWHCSKQDILTWCRCNGGPM